MQKTEYDFPAPLSCTVALVRDLHEHNPKPVLEILRQARPDVIAVAGDTLERHHRGENLDKGDRSLFSRLICAGIQTAEWLGGMFCPEQPAVRTEHAYRFFRQAGKIAPVVLSRGNHELYLTEEDRAVMSEAGVTLLDNDSVEISGVLFGGRHQQTGDGRTGREFSGALLRRARVQGAAEPSSRIRFCPLPVSHRPDPLRPLPRRADLRL